MPLKIMGTARDLRTKTPVVYGQLPISEFLDLVGSEFENFSIQRRREKHRAYSRLRTDLIEGALLPSITLAVRPERVKALLPLVNENDLDALANALSVPSGVDILDGLQRTFIIRDLHTEGVEFPATQTVHLEFWLEENTRHLVYRIIVLNAGQKPMSMRHQVELLFMALRERICAEIPDLELYTERETTRRRRARKYAMDRVAGAYHCFLIKSPDAKKENIVAQQLLEDEALDSSEDELNKQFEDFVQTLGLYAKLDDAICRVYATSDSDRGIPTGANWFGSENVMHAFFAGIAQFSSSEEKAQRALDAIGRLSESLAAASIGEDPLGIGTLQQLIAGLNPRRVNVGAATRKLLLNGFKEYFRDGGETPILSCWKYAAE